MKLLHVAATTLSPQVWTDVFREALAEFGELTLVADGESLETTQLAEIIRQHDVLLTARGSVAVPSALADDPGGLRYICHIAGTVRGCIPLELIEADIPVTNWGDAPAQALAEGAMALLMAAMKDLHHHILCQRQGVAATQSSAPGGGLEGTNVGIYGLGVTGLRFIEMLRPLRPVIRFYDPYVGEVPEDCLRVDSLEALFSQSQIIVIHAALTDETRHSVSANHLAMLPDHGIVINTARGAIVDHDALFAELLAGRLRAGLDVTDPEPLPPDHPARQLPNCIITPHCVGAGQFPGADSPPRLDRIHEVCLDNLRRFAAGEPLRFVMGRVRYARST